MRISGVLVALGLIAVVGCQPLYGNKPEALKNPPKKKPPPEAEVIETPIAWNEDCDVDFHGKPGTIPPNVPAARALSETATNTLVQADRSGDPKSRAGLTLEAIEKYKAALGKDPYNAEAT